MLEDLVVQLEFDNAAFVIDRASRTIFNRLRHIVNVDIVAEHFGGVAVVAANGRSSESDKTSVRKAIADNASSTLDPMRNQIALVILRCLDFFSQAVLTTVRFVRNHDDIAAVRKRLVRFFKLLHRRKDDAVRLAPVQQRFQMLARFCLLWNLSQKILAVGELRIKLIVKVIAVSNHHNRRAFNR